MEVRRTSRQAQVREDAEVVAGIGIIFAGEFEVLPRTSLTSVVGGGVAALGFWVHMRGRLLKP